MLERYLDGSEYAHHGERVVQGQRVMQAASDMFLGWQRVADIDGETRDYYIRQLHDWEGSVDVETMRVPAAMLYAQVCGETLARAYARSGDRIAISAYFGTNDTFDRAVTAFSKTYADQNEKDYQAFVKAAASGRMESLTGL